MFRAVEGVYRGAGFQFVGDGFRVSNYFPSGNRFMQRFSPFILLDYMAPHEWPPSETVRGVGAHPHRGFEAVTFVFEGHVEHHDNVGNHGLIGPGDVQWMTAGSGILHKEYQEKAFARSGGVMHAIQLWVNLPKAHKMTAPSYQTIMDGEMGRATLADEAGSFRVIAGALNGVAGPARTFSPITIADLTIHPGKTGTFQLPASYHVGMLMLQGTGTVNDDTNVTERDFVLMQNQDGKIQLTAGESGARVFVLSGEPIDETCIQYGPFVMNTKQEIQQAYDDFYDGKFGNPEF